MTKIVGLICDPIFLSGIPQFVERTKVYVRFDPAVLVHREFPAVRHVDPAALRGGAGPGRPRPRAAPGESLLLSPSEAPIVGRILRTGGSPLLLLATPQVVEAPDEQGHVLSFDQARRLDLLLLREHPDEVREQQRQHGELSQPAPVYPQNQSGRMDEFTFGEVS